MNKAITFICCAVFLLCTNVTLAQGQPPVDNGYYSTFPQNLSLRVFLSQKFVPFTLSSESEKSLYYRSTSKLSFGAGVTYKNITLNLAYGFSFLNNNKGQGATKGLDLQMHIFPHKWAIDLIGTFIKGFYLDPKDNNGLNLSNYYLRPDLHRNIAGLTIFRVANADRFSHKAAFTQNEWQTRSAGTLLYGMEAYYGMLQGDSAIVPSDANNNFKQAGITKLTFINAGPGVGYAYTLVIKKHFFITASGIGTLQANFASEEKQGVKETKVSALPAFIYKASAGYNSATWSVTADIKGNALYSASPYTSEKYFLPTGTIHFTVARKISLKKR